MKRGKAWKDFGWGAKFRPRKGDEGMIYAVKRVDIAERVKERIDLS